MELQLIQDNKYKLTYKEKSVIVTLLNYNKTINNKLDLYIELYDLIQDTLYIEYIEENKQYNDIEDLNRMKENKEIIEKVFSIDEIEDLENEIDELEYQF